MEVKRLYVVLINGSIATAAMLNDQDGDALSKFVTDKARFERVQVDRVEPVSTLFAAESEFESSLDSWTEPTQRDRDIADFFGETL